jgi:hypothetical protein
MSTPDETEPASPTPNEDSSSHQATDRQGPSGLRRRLATTAGTAWTTLITLGIGALVALGVGAIHRGARGPQLAVQPVGAQPVRPVFWCLSPTDCGGPFYAVFNSYVNTPNYGDERSFFDAKASTVTADGYFADTQGVSDGEVMHFRIYYNNDGNRLYLKGVGPIARNVRVRVALPRRSSQNSLTATATITASNTRPPDVSDDVTLTGPRPFSLQFISGSVKREYRPDGTHWKNATIDDAILSRGDDLGSVGWCFCDSGFVTLRARVSMPPNASVTPLAPAPNYGVWDRRLDAGPGRPVFRCTTTDYCPGPGFPALNSFSNDPVLGDEWSFIRGQSSAALDSTGVLEFGAPVPVAPGDRVQVQELIHNDADPRAFTYRGVDLDVRDLRGLVVMPRGAGTNLGVVGNLAARNTTPRFEWDDLQFTSKQEIRLKYLPGTAELLYTPPSTGVQIARPLPDALVVTAGSSRRMEKPSTWTVLRAPGIPSALPPGPASTSSRFVRFSVVVLPA